MFLVPSAIWFQSENGQYWLLLGGLKRSKHDMSQKMVYFVKCLQTKSSVSRKRANRSQWLIYNKMKHSKVDMKTKKYLKKKYPEFRQILNFCWNIKVLWHFAIVKSSAFFTNYVPFACVLFYFAVSFKAAPVDADWITFVFAGKIKTNESVWIERHF